MNNNLNLFKQALLGDLDFNLLFQIIPELLDLANCSQNHPNHYLDVFTHTIKVVEQLPEDLNLRLAALLHDIGKPECKVLGEDGFEHFWGHEKVGAKKAEAILKRLEIVGTDADYIIQLIQLHDTPLPDIPSEMKSVINKYGTDLLRSLLIIQKADLQAHSAIYYARKIPQLEKISDLFNNMSSND